MRRPQHMQRRELAAQAIVAMLFAVASTALFAVAGGPAPDPLDFVLLVLAAALLGRMEFEIGPGFTVPTQLIFVPMLFVLPPAVVPLAVVVAHIVDRVPDLVRRRWHPQRVLGSVGDAWFAVGPAAVFVAFGVDDPSLSQWPVFLLALAAQFAGDLGSSMLREWLGRGIAPQRQWRVLQQIWTIDALLAPIGLLAAFAAATQPRAYLLFLPVAALVPVVVRERRERIGHEIELSAAYRGTALLLGDVLSADDEYTGVHSQDVVVLALAIADELDVEEDERRLVEFGAMLHDIGKITTPPEILNKPGALTDAEWRVMRQHTIAGQRMLDRVGGLLHDVGRVVRSSHEHFDGSGYPDQLIGHEIPFAARIVAVADAYNAMTTRRPYRAPMSQACALAELEACQGSQFDPIVVSAALRMLSRAVPDVEPAALVADGRGAPRPRVSADRVVGA